MLLQKLRLKNMKTIMFWINRLNFGKGRYYGSNKKYRSYPWRQNA